MNRKSEAKRGGLEPVGADFVPQKKMVPGEVEKNLPVQVVELLLEIAALVEKVSTLEINSYRNLDPKNARDFLLKKPKVQRFLSSILNRNFEDSLEQMGPNELASLRKQISMKILPLKISREVHLKVQNLFQMLSVLGDGYSQL